MRRSPRRPPSVPRRPPASARRLTAAPIQPPAVTKTRWDKASVIVQAIGALAIVVSIGGLFIGVRQFNAQQSASAVQMLDQQRQATLTAYFDDMSVLVLQNNLTTSKQGASVRAIAIARTDTALRVLDGVRKGTLIRYLWEAGLITRQHPVVNLLNADLNGAVFAGANLYQVALSPLGLSHANFTAAGLIGADLSGSNLSGADLSGAALTCFYQSGNSRTGVCADLNGAYLTGANLTGANLTGANLTGANLQRARYNSKLIRVKNARGGSVTEEPTRWPRRFVPKAARAICVDC
jgi:hypothetical protein